MGYYYFAYLVAFSHLIRLLTGRQRFIFLRFPIVCMTVYWPTPPPVQSLQLVPVQHQSSRSVNLTIRFHLVPHLRIRGLVPQVLRTSPRYDAYLSKGTKVIFMS